jgi:hypothetical protein
MVHGAEQRKTEDLKSVREATASKEPPLSDEEVRHAMECSAILSEDSTVRVINLTKTMVEARKSNQLCMATEILKKLRKMHFLKH